MFFGRSGYFASLPNINLLQKNGAFNLTLPKSWSAWFYLRPKQLLVFFQDPIHLVTKLRNRLLSRTATLIMGRYDVSLKHLQDLVETRSKMDHNLVLSDLYVKDRQNYASCVKISSPDVLELLGDNDEALATHCYLSIIRFVILAYIDKATDTMQRLFYAWSAVFVCRFWWMWIQRGANGQRSSGTARNQLFITDPALISIELNAHSLMYILLLVIDKQLPAESLNIHLFSSQPCEIFFRSARSLNGSFSSMTNFSVYQFIRKAQKISILDGIKAQEQANADPCAIKFPTHHKQKQSSSVSSNLPDLNDISIKKIEQIIDRAYEYARSFADRLQMSNKLKADKVYGFNDLCSSVRDHFERTSNMFDLSELDSDDNDRSNASDHSIKDNDDDEEAEEQDGSDDDEVDDHEDEESDKEFSNVQSQNFKGMRIYDTINQADSTKYFKIIVNGRDKFMHKQTAVWYLTNKNCHLSSDRLVRVQTTTEQE